MKRIVQWLAATLTFIVPLLGGQARAGGSADSVVKVFTQMRLPNPVRPWIKQNPVEAMGSGVVIEGNRILTNAHLVLYADEIFVQGGRGGDRVEAKVAAIGPGIDLAVLTLEDQSFFAKRPAIPRASKLPEIDNEGMIQAEDNFRLSFMSQVPKLVRNGTVPVSVLRDGKTIELALPVSREPDQLLRGYDGRYPSYFVCGPLVFSPVVSNAISYYFQYNPMLGGRNSPLSTRRSDRAHFPGEELVVVTAPLLRTRLTKGYADPFGQVLSDVNGTKVKNLAHLVELIRSCQDEYLTFRFAEDFAETLVFRRKAMLEATEGLMSENGIPRRGSDDVLAVWNSKLAKTN